MEEVAHARGLLEEKTNRIIEIMISSVKPFDLMMGKIIGIGFVGLTQVFLWAVMTFILITGGTFFLGRRYGKRDLAIKHGT